jgi:hypothetical protein
MASSAPVWQGRWSGGKWTSQGGQWRQQQQGSQGPPGAAKAKSWGNGWSQDAAGWWSAPKKRTSGGKGSGNWGSWVGTWEPLSSDLRAASTYWSPPPKRGSHTQTKEEAAKQVLLIKAQLEVMNAHTCFDEVRQSLEKQLVKAERWAVDNRSDTKKLQEAESWAQRESKRLDEEKGKLADITTWIGLHQAALDKEYENIARMRTSIGAEAETRWEDPSENAEAGDSSMGMAQAELASLEARELELRRKRQGVDLSAAERTQLDADADRLQQLQSQKRRRIEAEIEEASRHP